MANGLYPNLLLTFLAVNLMILQVFDIYTTKVGIRLGGKELNPHFSPFQEDLYLFEKFLLQGKMIGIFLIFLMFGWGLITEGKNKILLMIVFFACYILMLAVVFSNFQTIFELLEVKKWN